MLLEKVYYNSHPSHIPSRTTKSFGRAYRRDRTVIEDGLQQDASGGVPGSRRAVIGSGDHLGRLGNPQETLGESMENVRK